MIAKQIPRKRGHRSDYARLSRYVVDARGRVDPASWRRTANYILDTAQGGAKVGGVRITNCGTDDPAAATLAILNTQQANTTTKGDKCLHLVISFPHDERPARAILDIIEDEICAAIGLGDHQRISAVHNDTAHMHLHIALSRIHPVTLRAANPWQSKMRLMRACERLEQQFGLTATPHGLERTQSGRRERARGQ